MSFMFNPYPYDDFSPLNVVELPEEQESSAVSGNAAVFKALAKIIESKTQNGRCVVALDGYVGTEFKCAVDALLALSPAAKAIDVASVYKSSSELESMLAETLPMDKDIDPVLLFGKLKDWTLDSLFDNGKVEELKKTISKAKGLTILFGQGSSCHAIKEFLDVVAFFDIAPLNAALKIKAGRVKNLGDAETRPVSQVFRRAYYYDYEILGAQRERLIDNAWLDLYIDANKPDVLRAMPCKALKATLGSLAKQPFRCKPAYIEGVWGGIFIKKLRNLPPAMKNCAWVFDLIPNEVSVLAKVGKAIFEIPFPTVFRAIPEKLMGEESLKRFGRLFPIRFNYDDTYQGGGSMSIQVHPPRDYATKNFGEPFQQDESYYIVATAGSKTYQGLKDDCNVDEFFEKLRLAETKHEKFDYEKYVNSFESKTGDQFLLPGGTIHSSGWNQVVLEIGSCTVGSYTFKLYDYLRSDLDGKPRPIHSKHGMNVLNQACRRSAIDGVLHPEPRVLREGRGWKEVLLGEHEEIFFSLHRLEFDKHVEDDTKGKFHVLALVEGEGALIYSKADPARCYKLGFCDMAIVPAALGEYGVLNLGATPCKLTKTLLK